MINVIFHNDNTEAWEGIYGEQIVYLPPGISNHQFQPVVNDEVWFVFGPIGMGNPYGASQPWGAAQDGALQVIYTRVENGNPHIVEKRFSMSITIA